jgi:hypothetical protein
MSTRALPAGGAPATAPAPPSPLGGRRLPGLRVVATDRWEDVDEALAVVHDGFVEAGYLEPQPSGRRMIAPYLNPGTVFFLATVDGEPVGALALIPDGPFGLPSDRSFREELDLIRRSGTPIFEAGSLVVRGPWRRHTRAIVAALVGASMRVFRETPGAVAVISVEPRQESFYRSMLAAERVAEPRPLFGAPALLLASTYEGMVDVMLSPRTTGQRLLRDLVLGRDASWIVDRRDGAAWPDEEVAALLAEQGCLARLLAQVRLLETTHPGLLRRV